MPAQGNAHREGECCGITSQPRSPPVPLTLSDRGKATLDRIFSEDVLQGELNQIRQFASDIGPDRCPYQIADFFAAMEAQALINNMIEELPIGPWTNESAALAVAQLVQAVELVPIACRQLAESRILERTVLWESAHSYLTVYRWYTDIGPTLARVLFDAHRQGSNRLRDRYPKFEPLVDHIFRYIQCLYSQKNAGKSTKFTGQTSRKQSNQATHDPDYRPVHDKVPADFFGLLPVQNKRLVKLPSVTTYRLSAELDNQYSHAIEVFQSLFSDHVVLERMRDADSNVNSGRRRTGDDLGMIRTRCIIRGALVSFIVDVFKDDDGIFAFPLMETLLTSPSLLFNAPITKDADLSARILADPAGALRCVNEYISGRLSQAPAIVSIANDIGETVFQAASTLSAQPTGVRFRLPSQVRKHSRSGRASNKVSDPLPTGPVCLETLLGGKEDTPFFGLLALMIREVLNQRRGHSMGNEMLNRVLQGLTPTTGNVVLSDGEDIDHFMPLRWDSEYARLLSKHLPPHLLVTSAGISSLLVWMTTGQGSLTKEFVNNNNMYFKSLDEAVATFQRARDQHALGESIVFENMRVWGQSARALSFKAMQGLTIREKLAPFFTSEVQADWKKTLGLELADHPDPKSYSGKRPTWMDIRNFAMRHKFIGLMDGLTQIQFANNVALAYIASHPTMDEISPWIAKHPKLGAYGGLRAMGFSVAPGKSGEPWVRGAFRCVYDHLDLHLSQEDKDELRFGAMFVEHLLCKLVRWIKVFERAKIGVNLATMAHAAANDKVPWICGANYEDSTGQLMPIPLRASEQQLKNSISAALE
jgi:hypothetical protein